MRTYSREEENERIRLYKMTEQGQAAQNAWREKRRAANAIAQAPRLAALAERRAEAEAAQELKSQVRRMLQDKRIKKCPQCEQVLEWADFYWDKALRRPESFCKRCTSQNVQAWREKHKEQVAVARRAARPRYHEEHREQYREDHRAAKHRRKAYKLGNGGTYTGRQWAALKAKYQHRCLACGQSEPTILLTVDHVVPLSQGGTNDISNLQPLCSNCNAQKGAQTRDYRQPQTSTYTATWENGPEIHQQASFLDQCS